MSMASSQVGPVYDRPGQSKTGPAFSRRCFALILSLFLTTGALAAGRTASYMRWNLDWNVTGGLPEKVLLLSLQGLANRSAPQFYVVHPREYQWEITEPLFDFYQRKHGVQFTELKTAEEALTKFAAVDPQTAQLVSLRYFAGLTLKETADTLRIAPRTADARWAYARAWLMAEMQRQDGPDCLRE